jgi:hypothetical protein
MYWKGLEPSELLEYDPCLVTLPPFGVSTPGSRKNLTTPLNFTSRHNMGAMQRDLDYSTRAKATTALTNRLHQRQLQQLISTRN